MADIEFSKIAQQMVEATSSLVSGRTVNIMDTDGIIVASTEKERIGTLHGGAAVAAKTGKPVAIEKDRVALYPGSKEGCNMPMFSGGKLLGVVGIYGNPAEVSDTARLLSVYTVQYFEQNASLQQQMVENELRSKLLSLLMNLDAKDSDTVGALMKALHIRLRFPVRVFTVGIRDRMDSVGSLYIFNAVLTQFRARGYLDAKHDVWGVYDDRIVVIKSGADENEGEQLARIREMLNEHFDTPLRICIGYMSRSAEEIRRSADEAGVLFEMGGDDLSDMADTHCFVKYALFCTERQQRAYVETLYERLMRCFGERDLPVAMESIACYYDLGGSVNRAAERLHIHKNTLQYRVRRVWDALGVTDMTPFERECLVRLCIRYERRNKSDVDDHRDL